MKAWTPKQIRSLRHRLGDTQAEFAVRLGVSKKLVTAWEQPETREDGTRNTGHRTPSAMARKLLVILEKQSVNT